MTAPPLDAATSRTVTIDGRELVSFGGCNYLGLAQHPEVLEVAREAISRYGLSTSASRETTGNTRVHSDLEMALAAFCGFERGLLMPDGYSANLAALQLLQTAGIERMVVDERAHPSLTDAARMVGVPITRFRHLSAQSAIERLHASPAPTVIATDSIFAADGSRAPVAALQASQRIRDLLLLDDCHGFAVVGPQGRGTASDLVLNRERLVVTTTLAKGLGCHGGVVLGPDSVAGTARKSATAYVCTTPVSPIIAAAAHEAVRVLERTPGLHEALIRNVRAVRSGLCDAGVKCGDSPTAIVAFPLGDRADELDAMQALHAEWIDRGLYVPLVDYPGGPSPWYFRLSVSASHTNRDIALLAGAVQASLAGRVGPR